MDVNKYNWEFASFVFMLVAASWTTMGGVILWFVNPFKRKIDNYQKTVDFVESISNPESPLYLLKIVEEHKVLWKIREEMQSETFLNMQAEIKRLKDINKQKHLEEFNEIKTILKDLQKEMAEVKTSCSR